MSYIRLFLVVLCRVVSHDVLILRWKMFVNSEYVFYFVANGIIFTWLPLIVYLIGIIKLMACKISFRLSPLTVNDRRCFSEKGWGQSICTAYHPFRLIMISERRSLSKVNRSLIQSMWYCADVISVIVSPVSFLSVTVKVLNSYTFYKSTHILCNSGLLLLPGSFACSSL